MKLPSLKTIVILTVAILSFSLGLFVKNSHANVCSNKVDYLLVDKSDKTLKIYDTTNCVMKTYNVRVGIKSGCKTREGDMKTPCGEYKIIEKRNSNEKYVKFLHLNYPNTQDRAKGYTGTFIGIHYFNKDVSSDPEQMKGSAGCITVFKKSEILEINSLVSVGTKVIIQE